jgi:hypothetical protein
MENNLTYLFKRGEIGYNLHVVNHEGKELVHRVELDFDEAVEYALLHNEKKIEILMGATHENTKGNQLL